MVILSVGQTLTTSDPERPKTLFVSMTQQANQPKMTDTEGILKPDRPWTMHFVILCITYMFIEISVKCTRRNPCHDTCITLFIYMYKNTSVIKIILSHMQTDKPNTTKMKINDPERPWTILFLLVFLLIICAKCNSYTSEMIFPNHRHGHNKLNLSVALYVTLEVELQYHLTNFVMYEKYSKRCLMSTPVDDIYLLTTSLMCHASLRKIIMSVMNQMYCTLNGRRCINLSQLIYHCNMIKICNDDIKSNIPCHVSINGSSSASTCDVDLRSVKSDILCFNSMQFDVFASFCSFITENMHKNHGQGTRQTWEFPFSLVTINRTRPGHPHIKGSVKKKVNKFLSVFTHFKASNGSNPDQIIMKTTRILLRLSRYMFPYVWQAKLSGKEHESQNIKFKKKPWLVIEIFTSLPSMLEGLIIYIIITVEHNLL